MSADKFRDDLLAHLNDFRRTLSSDKGDWTVNGNPFYTRHILKEGRVLYERPVQAC